MNNRTIPNITPKERKIYSASFNKYSHNDRAKAFLNLTNVRDDKGNIIKTHFSVEASAAIKLIGKLLPEQEVLFSAEVVTGEDHPDGFGFIKVSFIMPE